MKVSELILKLESLTLENGEDLEVYWTDTGKGYILICNAELAIGVEGDKMACLSLWGLKFFSEANRRHPEDSKLQKA